MKQKTVFTRRDAFIILGILAFLILVGSVETIADALANFLTR